MTCPLRKTNHYPCGFLGDDPAECQFRYLCTQIQEDLDRDLIARLHEAARLVKYYDTVEGERASSPEQRMNAKDNLLDLREQADAHGLQYNLDG